jgi:hypothetical protein
MDNILIVNDKKWIFGEHYGRRKKIVNFIHTI